MGEPSKAGNKARNKYARSADTQTGRQKLLKPHEALLLLFTRSAAPLPSLDQGVARQERLGTRIGRVPLPTLTVGQGILVHRGCPLSPLARSEGLSKNRSQLERPEKTTPAHSRL